MIEQNKKIVDDAIERGATHYSLGGGVVILNGRWLSRAKGYVVVGIIPETFENEAYVRQALKHRKAGVA